MKKTGIVYSLPLAALVGLGGYFLAGYYPIGADTPHWSLTEGLIAQVRDASIERMGQRVPLPEDLGTEQQVRRGAGNYAAMCAACHLTPAEESSELQRGLYPRPPRLAESGIDDAARAFAVIKHGIKLTGMPAWGSSHSDGEIWELVAFLQRLPSLTADEYQALSEAGHSHADDHHPTETGAGIPAAGGHTHTHETAHIH